MAAFKALAFLALLTTDTVLAQTGADILNYVDPLIGTVNGGHVFPGASLPFGMAKAVADVDGERQGGFASDGSNVTGFSHMHDSGTGGVSACPVFSLASHAACDIWPVHVMTCNQNYNSLIFRYELTILCLTIPLFPSATLRLVYHAYAAS